MNVGGRGRVMLLGGLLGLLLVAPAPAQARLAYVANAGFGDVSAINTETGQVLGEPIPTDAGATAIALTPDGRFAFVANSSASDVSVIDTETNQVVGESIKVSSSAFHTTGVAISPNGNTAYVTSEGGLDPGELTRIDVATKQLIGQPLKLEQGAGAVAIAPDGRQAYVMSYSESGALWLVRSGADSVARRIDVGAGRLGEIAVTPDGARILVTDPESNGVSVIDADTFQILGPPIEVGAGPRGLAISPDGRYAYVADDQSAAISVIDIAANQAVGDIPVGEFPTSVTFSPDGNRAYVVGDNPGWMTTIDTKTRQVSGEPIEVGAQPEAIAVVPDQAPVASSSSSVQLGVPVAFDGLGSSDPDGRVARYDWSFGDGATALDAGPNPAHSYGLPGTYQVALTVTDNEGCSTALVFTGQSAYCNGSPRASQAQDLTVSAPLRPAIELVKIKLHR